MSARAGHFDSGFPEVGPPPLLTKKGIVLIYNGKNSTLQATDAENLQVTDAPAAKAPLDANAEVTGQQFASDPKIRPGTYSVGEALFSASDPAKLLDRTNHPILTPIWPYERNGQYAAGTTFAEGLVPYQGQWFLYYGAADSAVGVARAEVR